MSSCEAEVANFYLTTRIKKQVDGLEVTMDNPLGYWKSIRS